MNQPAALICCDPNQKNNPLTALCFVCAASGQKDMIEDRHHGR